MEAAAGGRRGKIGRKNVGQKKTELQERHRMKNKTDKRKKSEENFVASILSSIMNVSRLDKNFSSYSSLQNVNKQRPYFFSPLGRNLPSISVQSGSLDKWPPMETPACVPQLYFVRHRPSPVARCLVNKTNRNDVPTSCPPASSPLPFPPKPDATLLSPPTGPPLWF